MLSRFLADLTHQELAHSIVKRMMEEKMKRRRGERDSQSKKLQSKLCYRNVQLTLMIDLPSDKISTG